MADAWLFATSLLGIAGTTWFYLRCNDLTEVVEFQNKQIAELRAELLTSLGENQTLLEEKQKIKDYSDKLLAELTQKHNQGCRVNPGNPNITITKHS
jgi:regulator of replication initiation timing